MGNKNIFARRQERFNKMYIKKEDVTWNDVPFYQYMAMYILSGIFMEVIHLFIFKTW